MRANCLFSCFILFLSQNNRAKQTNDFLQDVAITRKNKINDFEEIDSIRGLVSVRFFYIKRPINRDVGSGGRGGSL